MFSAVKASIQRTFTGAPYNVAPIWSQTIRTKELDGWPFDESFAINLRAKIPSLCLETLATITQVICVIRQNDCLVYKNIFFQFRDKKIQVFIHLGTKVSFGSSATVYNATRILFEKIDQQVSFVKASTIVLSELVIATFKDNTLTKIPEAASRAQAAEQFKDINFVARTHGWCIAHFGGKNPKISLIHFMRKYDCDLLTYSDTQSDTTTPTISLFSKVRVLNDVSSGLEQIHAMGFIHRDIKSENILVEVDEVTREIKKVRICDFGSMTSRHPSDPRLMRLAGSPAWMPREVLEHLYHPNIVQAIQQYLTPCLDYGSLGLVLGELEHSKEPQQRWQMIWWDKLNAFAKKGWISSRIPHARFEKWKAISQKTTTVATTPYEHLVERLQGPPSGRPTPKEIALFVNDTNCLIDSPKINRTRRNSI